MQSSAEMNLGYGNRGMYNWDESLRCSLRIELAHEEADSRRKESSDCTAKPSFAGCSTLVSASDESESDDKETISAVYQRRCCTYLNTFS